MIAKIAREAQERTTRLKPPSFAAFDVPVAHAAAETISILGLPLLAAVLGRDPSVVEAWSVGAEPGGNEDLALRTTLHAARMISCRLPVSIVRRWFISPCDEIGCRSPLEALARMADDGDLETRAKILLAVERFWKVR